MTSQVVEKKKGCHKKERNSQKSGSRNSTGCKAIASSMPKPKTRCTSVEAETAIMLTQRGTGNLYNEKEVISGKKNCVRSIKVENTAMLNQTHRKASAMKRKQAQEQNWKHKDCIKAENTKQEPK